MGKQRPPRKAANKIAAEKEMLVGLLKSKKTAGLV
jgi:hypothetical protein